MKRIGVAASKIAKDNIILYNLYVVLIAFLFSLFVFVMAGALLIFAFTIIMYVGNEVMPADFIKDWSSIFKVCMISLAMIVVVFNLTGIFLNIKIQKRDTKHVE
jgi:integral membrane sensor domain MASE1